MSRKRLPDNIKVLQGTARAGRMNPDAPVPPTAAPEPPEWLSSNASEQFRRLTAISASMGTCSPVDVDVFALLASRLEEVEILTATIEDQGRTYLSESGLWKGRPEVAMRSEAMRHAHSLLVEFGLTPSARSKVSAAVPVEENPFAALDRM